MPLRKKASGLPFPLWQQREVLWRSATARRPCPHGDGVTIWSRSCKAADSVSEDLENRSESSSLAAHAAFLSTDMLPRDWRS